MPHSLNKSVYMPRSFPFVDESKDGKHRGAIFGIMKAKGYMI